MKSIQSKILFVVIAGLLVITAVVSAIAVSMAHEVMHRDADRILKNAAQREAAEINDVLGDVVKSCGIMEHYAVEEVGDPNALRDETFRAQYVAKTEKMFSEVALNTNGIAGFYLRLAPAYSNGTSGFYKLMSQDGQLRDMPLTDLTQYDEDDERNVGWYYAAVKARKAVWMEPYSFPGTTGLMISYTVPLYVGRNLIGVRGFDMDFGFLLQRVDEISVYEGGEAVLLAKDSVTPYNHAQGEHTHPHGESHADIKVELKNGMFLELRADYKDIQKEIRPMLSQIVYAFLAVLVCAVAYTIFVTRKIVQPLKQLTAAAKGISSGVEDEAVSDIPVDSNDEIGTLARVLSDAYAKIREYTAYINALAYRDSLTGIKNTTAYTEAVRDLNKGILTGNPRFGVLVADINNLKQTNDQFGHDVGNDLIVRTARILTETFATSVVFRIGGDEFAVVLQDEDYKNYHALMKRLDEACGQATIAVGEHAVPVSVARGVALFDPAIDHVYEDVFARADAAMYINKEESKASVLR